MNYVGIGNLALAHIGQRGTISSLDPPEGSEHAERVSQFIDLARDVMLEAAPWNFATRRVAGAAIATEVAGWGYVYTKPADAVRILSVQSPQPSAEYAALPGLDVPAITDAPYILGRTWADQPWVIETLADGSEVILSNVENAVIRYVRRITDPTKFSAQFVEAMAQRLAAMLAGPIIKGSEGIALAQRCTNEAMRLAREAMVSDARQEHQILRPVPSSLAIR